MEEWVCGAVCCTVKSGVRHYLLIENESGHIGFPKGHQEGEESEEETALREVQEETGITIRFDPIFRRSYSYCFPRNIHRPFDTQANAVQKHATYFLGHFAPSQPIRIQEEEIRRYWLLPFTAALERLNFQQDRLILAGAEQQLSLQQQNYAWILWDWNGTLADDLEISLRCVNDTLRKRNREAITLEQYYQYMDTPISRFYEHLFDLEQVPFQQLSLEYHDGYTQYITPDSLMEGAAGVLQTIQEHGIAQMILSSYAQKELLTYTGLFGVQSFFQVISGADDYLAAEKATRAKRLLEEYNVDPRQALVVGDSLPDYTMAKQIGAACVLIAKGHQSRQDLESCGVTVLDDIRQLPPLLFPNADHEPK